MPNKVNSLSQDAKDTISVLKNATEPQTLAEISALVGRDIKSGTVVSLVKKGILAKGDDKEVKYTATKMVGTYSVKE